MIFFSYFAIAINLKVETISPQAKIKAFFTVCEPYSSRATSGAGGIKTCGLIAWQLKHYIIKYLSNL